MNGERGSVPSPSSPAKDSTCPRKWGHAHRQRFIFPPLPLPSRLLASFLTRADHRLLAQQVVFDEGGKLREEVQSGGAAVDAVVALRVHHERELFALLLQPLDHLHAVLEVD